MEILAWIIIGVVIGLIAKLLSENTSREDGELILILAVVGSVAGGFISSAMGLTAENRWGTGTITTSIAGAVSILLTFLQQNRMRFYHIKSIYINLKDERVFKCDTQSLASEKQPYQG